MSQWRNGALAVVVLLGFGVVPVRANDNLYQDDDLLCRPGWSPEIYHDRLQHGGYQQIMTYSPAELIAQQQAWEKMQAAHRARLDKAARRRQELVAKRKAENLKRNAGVAVSSKDSGPVRDSLGR